MSFPRSVSGRRRGAQRRGFALLLTVTLLAFAVLLLVGLATYTRIETAIAGNMQRQAQARENALMALNVALGQLQKQAGPDKRVTATATDSANPYWTGAWTTDPNDPNYATPAWLVSGLESATPPDPATALSQTDGTSVQLVGAKTVTSTTEHVWAKKQAIAAPGFPGQSGSAVIGRYAWWVGDQGVKAPVALADTSGAVDFAPYDSADLRSRIRQQISLGAGAADAAGAPVFEPQDTSGSPSGATLAASVLAPSQLAFMRPAGSSSGTIGLATQRKYFHTWAPNNFAVLANTKAGGLRQDLSLQPDLLGPEFQAWADYPSYMEDPFAAAAGASSGASGGTTSASATTGPITIQPAYGADPLRRRHLFRGDTKPYRIAPVLSFFGLSFSLRNDQTGTDLEVSARCVVGLWNPYTSALVPEDLQIIVHGLPNDQNHVNVHDSDSEVASPPTHRHVNLARVMADQIGGGDLKFFLPFTPDGTHEDTSSWLPGRVYNWSAESNTSDPSNGKGKPMAFYERAAAQSGSGIVRSAGAGAPLPISTTGSRITRWCSVNAETNLTIELIRASDGERLAQFNAPVFAEFETEHDRLDTNDQYLDFAFIFRLSNGPEIPLNESAPWLQAAGRDPREHDFPRSGYVGPGFGLLQDGRISPALLIPSRKTDFDASYPDLLLDRAPAARSYNEDAPLFELPRAPLLSMGTLQHLAIAGSRPFAISNSWGAALSLNGIPAGELFDRYFFSGLVSNVTPTINPTGDLVMPNPLLKPLRKGDGSKPAVADVRALTDARSSKFFLEGGAFNLNSTNQAAWAAVLRGVRFPDSAKFTYLDADSGTGTAADSAVQSVSSADAHFFRFSQSAQETYKAESGQSGGAAATELFRQGSRSLDAAKVAALATRITAAVKARLTNTDPTLPSGPFRSLEEFLSPINGGPSLLEQAIADAGINVDTSGNAIEFSSQFLTQGDIMTALAPVLFPRSDTFVIRSYGEVVNPVTNGVEGRAWAEAIVQRLPEYLDPTDAPDVDPVSLSDINKANGRRFKVVSFRWLTRSDI